MPEGGPAPACPSCSAPRPGAWCAACGEKARAPGDLTLRALAGQFADALFNLDARLWRSLWLLVARPGFLAREYVRGARVPYMRPVQLFLVANLAYFLLQPLTIANAFNTGLDSHLGRQEYSSIARPMVERHLQRTGEDPQAFRARFDARSDALARTLIILLVVLLVPLFALLQWRTHRLLAEHVVFSLHFTSHVLLVASLAVAWLVEAALAAFAAAGGDPRTVPAPLVELPVLLAYAWWLVRGFRTFYGNRPFTALLLGLAATLLSSVPIFGYRFLLFLLTLASA